MIERLGKDWRSFLLLGIGLLAGGMIFALLIAYSGIFNIAASAGHPAWMESFLQFGKERSIIFNSRSVEPPALEPAELLPLGSAHFQGTCAICHGTPLQPVNPIFGHMLPHPPDLQHLATDWTRAQLFWIARHGLQFTGMPAWSGENRDDEVWAVAAFLEALPSMTAADYRRYAGGHSQVQDVGADRIASAGRARLDLTACGRCHDTADASPVSPCVPRIGGQAEAYLKRALHDYRDDMRQSGFMEPVAGDLDDDHIERLAVYYAALKPVFRQLVKPPSSTEEREAGRQLAEQGDSARKVSACNSCHGRKGREDYPRLAGQSATYIRKQLRLWRQGGRDRTPHGAMMAVVAKRMTDPQVAAASAFYASQPLWAEQSPKPPSKP